MAELHRAYINIGSNIRPEIHLPRALELLREYGEVEAVSQAWESHAVGSSGPNFLNACLLFRTSLGAPGLKEQVIRNVEARLGRVRGPDKNAPRTVDLDIVLFDAEALDPRHWQSAFVLVPLAELLPDFRHPLTGERLSSLSERLRRETWILPRPEVILSAHQV